MLYLILTVINIVKHHTSFGFLPATYSVKKVERNALQMCLLLTRKLSNPYKGSCCVFMYFWYCFIKSVNIWSCVCNWCNTLQFPAKESVKDTINPLQLFIFTTVMRCSRLQLWVGYFIYLKFTHVSSIVYQLLHLLQLDKQID